MIADYDYHPRFEDYFPHTRRGHGTTHPEAKYDRDGNKVREACRCVELSCELNAPKSKNKHRDRAANIKDWETERGR